VNNFASVLESPALFARLPKPRFACFLSAPPLQFWDILIFARERKKSAQNGNIVQKIAISKYGETYTQLRLTVNAVHVQESL
jgi:hypothetical protein